MQDIHFLGWRLQTSSSNHTGDFKKGDKVWFQLFNGTSWLRPAAVICHRGKTMWLHKYGNVKKVAACQVKPFQLIDLISIENESEVVDDRRKVMPENGLQDVDDIQNKDDHQEEEKDSMGAKYLKIVNSVSFLTLPSTQLSFQSPNMDDERSR